MTDLEWCIEYLKEYNKIEKLPNIPPREVFRALENVTMPEDLSEEYYKKEERVLKTILSEKTVTDVDTFKDGISVFKGDITLLKADAIVNACNSKMLGCFVPGHHCIDNAIHSFAGLKVRRDMMKIMQKQGHDEKNGECKVTSAYCLPSKYIFHTVYFYSFNRCTFKRIYFGKNNLFKTLIFGLDDYGQNTVHKS